MLTEMYADHKKVELLKDAAEELGIEHWPLVHMAVEYAVNDAYKALRLQLNSGTNRFNESWGWNERIRKEFKKHHDHPGGGGWLRAQCEKSAHTALKSIISSDERVVEYTLDLYDENRGQWVEAGSSDLDSEYGSYSRYAACADTALHVAGDALTRYLSWSEWLETT